eukprot:6198208-Pleurochrysis_carterae.AAC.1
MTVSMPLISKHHQHLHTLTIPQWFTSHIVHTAGTTTMPVSCSLCTCLTQANESFRFMLKVFGNANTTLVVPCTPYPKSCAFKYACCVLADLEQMSERFC